MTGSYVIVMIQLLPIHKYIVDFLNMDLIHYDLAGI